MTDSVHLRLYAAARSAAGIAELEVSPATLSTILSRLSFENSELENVIRRCSFLVDGVVSHDLGMEVCAGSTVDVLPPFAGG